MEHDNIAMEKTPTNKEESSGGSKKGTTSSSISQRQQEQQQQQQQQVLKCPRCDSMNTKFCYYNNYSLTQPRHFCKSCRRYWTKGGSLRNVPIGGGCRKSKKLKSLSLNSSRDSPTSSDPIGRLKFFHGFSSSSPTIDFQLGGLSIPRLNLSSPPSSGVLCNQLSSNNSSFQDIEGSSLGINFSLPPLFKQQSENNVPYDVVRTQDEAFVGNQVAASIESLSSINQDLHWKLQQQRFAAMLFGGNNNLNNIPNENNVSQGLDHQQIQRPQPILFQNLDLSSPRPSGGSWEDYSRKDGQSGNLETGYFFDNDTCAPTMNSTRPTTSNGANNGNDSASWNNNGAQAWNNLDQFNVLP